MLTLIANSKLAYSDIRKRKSEQVCFLKLKTGILINKVSQDLNIVG